MTQAKWRVGAHLWVKVPKTCDCRACGHHHNVIGEFLLVEVEVEAVNEHRGYSPYYWVHPLKYDSTYRPADSSLFYRWICEKALGEIPEKSIDHEWSER